MLATNPVVPNPCPRSRSSDPPARTPPGRAGTSPSPSRSRKFLGVSALLVAGYIVLGTLGADAAGPAAKEPAPVAKAAPTVAAPVATPVPGDFRLAPGNTMPQGVVVRLGVPAPFPGDFRLAPGNNMPPGIFTGR